MATILIIEDDDGLRTMAAHVLREAGHIVIEARDGIVGLELFRHLDADVVITDMQMPKMEGLEVLEELRKRKSPVKMIAMSGSGPFEPTDTLGMAALIGARILSKPFSLDELMAAVNEQLRIAATPAHGPAR
jgi:DNA-binding response OmpR family regulator